MLDAVTCDEANALVSAVAPPRQKMSKKKEVQVQITSDAQWREVLKEPGCFFLEIYSEKWGQCACFKGTVQKMFYEHMGWCKFYAAPVEKVKALIEHDCVEPVFAVYVEGKKIELFTGVDGPKLEQCLAKTKADRE